MDFATKLKCYRQMLNFTQNDIANAMGVDRSTYAYYEIGKTIPNSEGIKMLSKLFGVSPATLLNEEPVEPPKPTQGILVFQDAILDILNGTNDERNIDMTFPELTEDEKELILQYRMMKATKSNGSEQEETDTKELIRDFILENDK